MTTNSITLFFQLYTGCHIARTRVPLRAPLPLISQYELCFLLQKEFAPRLTRATISSTFPPNQLGGRYTPYYSPTAFGYHPLCGIAFLFPIRTPHRGYASLSAYLGPELPCLTQDHGSSRLHRSWRSCGCLRPAATTLGLLPRSSSPELLHFHLCIPIQVVPNIVFLHNRNIL